MPFKGTLNGSPKGVHGPLGFIGSISEALHWGSFRVRILVLWGFSLEVAGGGASNLGLGL